MKTTGESGEGLGRRERVTLPPGNVTHLTNIHNNVTSLVFTQNHCAATGPLGFWVLQSFLSTLLRSLQRELGGSMLVRLLAIGNQVPLSGLRGSLHGLPVGRKCVLRLCFLSALES